MPATRETPVKHIIEFNMPEEHAEHEAALNGFKYKIILQDLHNLLRQKWKYEDKEEISIDELRDWLVNEQEEHEVNIWG